MLNNRDNAINSIYEQSITLPRGTLDLTYQTNADNSDSDNDKSHNKAYQLDDLLGFA